jgi:hypothetical protein
VSGAHDRPGEGVDGFAWVQVSSAFDQCGKVRRRGVAVEHSVGGQEQTVAGLQPQGLNAVGMR